MSKKPTHHQQHLPIPEAVKAPVLPTPTSGETSPKVNKQHEVSVPEVAKKPSPRRHRVMKIDDIFPHRVHLEQQEQKDVKVEECCDKRKDDERGDKNGIDEDLPKTAEVVEQHLITAFPDVVSPGIKR